MNPNTSYRPSRTLLAALVAWGATMAIPGTAPADGFWFGAAPTYRGGLKLELKSNASAWNAPAVGKGRFGTIDDPLGAYADRTFDDGYVKKDAGTGNPSSIDPGVTWNWGYDSHSQVGGGRLEFHRTSTRVAGETFGPGADMTETGLGRDIFGGAGAEVFAGVELFGSGDFELHLAMGLGGIWGLDAELSGVAAEGSLVRCRTVDKVTDTYVYDVSGITMPVAPHRGTYDGPFGNPPVIPSPTIPNKPLSATREGTRTLQTKGVAGSQARDTLDIDAEMDLWSAWVGPQFRLGFCEKGRLWLAPQVSFNLADVEVSRDETLWKIGSDGAKEAIGAWHDRENEQKFLLGLGASAGLEWEFDNGFFAGAFGRYEWMTDKIDVTVGPSEVSIDASSYTVGALVGYRFGGNAGEQN